MQVQREVGNHTLCHQTLEDREQLTLCEERIVCGRSPWRRVVRIWVPSPPLTCWRSLTFTGVQITIWMMCLMQVGNVGFSESSLFRQTEH